MSVAPNIAAALFEYPPAATVTVTFRIINVILVLSTVMSALETRSIASNNISNYIIIAVINIYGNHLFLLFNLNTNNLFLVGNFSSTKLANNIFT